MPATSLDQAKMMRMVLAARRGKMPPDKLKGSAKKVYEGNMTNEQIKDFTKQAMPKAYAYTMHKQAAVPLLLKPLSFGAKGLLKGGVGAGTGLAKWTMKGPLLSKILKGMAVWNAPKGIRQALSLKPTKPF